MPKNTQAMMYHAVKPIPAIIPHTAGTVPTRLVKIPSTMAGKKLAAAKPKAKATTWLTNPGG